tara:strand:- start:1412 stop:1600 length:189 start_codon:yes stop_codon:yes gene_type:complete
LGKSKKRIKMKKEIAKLEPSDKGQYLINSIFNTKYLIRDVFELDTLLDIKKLLDEQINELTL